MKIAVVGSRSLRIDNLENYLPEETTEIISGGAKGIDECAKRFALEKGMCFLEILPEYKKYGKAAPIIRNKIIVDMVDEVIAFWDGKSKGTKYVIDYCRKQKQNIKVFLIE